MSASIAECDSRNTPAAGILACSISFSCQDRNVTDISRSEVIWRFQNGAFPDGRRQICLLQNMTVPFRTSLRTSTTAETELAKITSLLPGMGNGMTGKLVYKLSPERFQIGHAEIK